MDFEPHNFPALVTSVIRSDPRLAEPLKEIFAAYARDEDLEEIWSRIDSKFHQSLRLILDDLNEIDDPVSLDQEVQVLLHAIDQALVSVEEDAGTVEPERTAKVKKKARKPAAKPAAQKKKKVARTPAGKKKSAKKAVKKATAPKKKKLAKKSAGKKKVAAPKKKKAGKAAARKPAKKSSATKKAKPAKKKKKK